MTAQLKVSYSTDRPFRIGLLGRAYSGKTTLANYIRQNVVYKNDYLGNTSPLILSFADPLKRMLENNEVDLADKEKVRSLMQEVGTAFRNYNPNFFVEKLVESLGDIYPIVVDDVRYKNEADALLDKGFSLFYISSHLKDRLKRGAPEELATSDHPSEAGYALKAGEGVTILYDANHSTTASMFGTMLDHYLNSLPEGL